MGYVDDIHNSADQQIGSILENFARDQETIKDDVALTDQEREDMLLDAHENNSRQYREVIEQRNAEYEELAAELQYEAFGAPEGSSASAAYTSATLAAYNASDEALTGMAALAATTGDEIMGKAVAAVAMQRGNLGLAAAWVNSSDENKTLFRDLAAIPNAEQRAKSTESRLPLPDLDNLRPSPQRLADAERSATVDRMRRRSAAAW